MESRLFLNVVVRKSSAILKLLASEDKSLLVWGNSFLVLNNKVKRSLRLVFEFENMTKFDVVLDLFVF